MSSRVYFRMLKALQHAFSSRVGPAPKRPFTAPSHRVSACSLALLCALGIPNTSYAQAPQPSVAAPQEPQTATQLFNRLATLTGLEATFVETKKLALLRMPLQSEGTLYYMQPGYLLREVSKPKPSRVLITPEKLELRDAQNSRQIDLRSRPDVKLFVESFTKVLAGDEATLAQGFNIQFEPRPGAAATPSNDVWRLTLTPKSSPLDKLVTKVTLSGKGYAVERIEVFETKGDSSETTMRVTKVGRSFTPAEKQGLFGIGPAPNAKVEASPDAQ
jgi:outer membrane lipoprotein-sorting protein